jgi:hypothetical protein
MSSCRYLYNVNRILVDPDDIDEYITFSAELDQYLRRNYNGYYAGLQLYRSKKNRCEFFVVARYNDIFGLDNAVRAIQQIIKKQYKETFGDSVTRENVFSFLNAKRIYC